MSAERPEKAGHLQFDTVTLSDFALAGRIDLLTDRYGRRAWITSEVLSEVLEGVSVGYRELRAIEEALEGGRLGDAGTLSSEERQVFQELLRSLAPGESSCVACAKVRGGAVVSDDRACRARCEELEVPYTGTIGILKASVRDGALSADEADRVLGAMIDAGYFSPVRRISDLV